jgi:hypothetical protein
MSDYHGILVDKSLNDQGFLKKFEILSKRFSNSRSWFLLKVRVASSKIDKAIKEIQQNLKENYYAHFYREGELIIVFKQRVFKVKPDESTWKEAVEYGLSVGIPMDQLDMKPHRFEDETW